MWKKGCKKVCLLWLYRQSKEDNTKNENSYCGQDNGMINDYLKKFSLITERIKRLSFYSLSVGKLPEEVFYFFLRVTCTNNKRSINVCWMETNTFEKVA